MARAGFIPWNLNPCSFVKPRARSFLALVTNKSVVCQVLTVESLRIDYASASSQRRHLLWYYLQKNVVLLNCVVSSFVLSAARRHAPYKEDTRET